MQAFVIFEIRFNYLISVLILTFLTLEIYGENMS